MACGGCARRRQERLARLQAQKDAKALKQAQTASAQKPAEPEKK